MCVRYPNVFGILVWMINRFQIKNDNTTFISYKVTAHPSKEPIQNTDYSTRVYEYKCIYI